MVTWRVGWAAEWSVVGEGTLERTALKTLFSHVFTLSDRVSMVTNNQSYVQHF